MLVTISTTYAELVVIPHSLATLVQLIFVHNVSCAIKWCKKITNLSVRVADARDKEGNNVFGADSCLALGRHDRHRCELA